MNKKEIKNAFWQEKPINEDSDPTKIPTTDFIVVLSFGLSCSPHAVHSDSQKSLIKIYRMRAACYAKRATCFGPFIPGMHMVPPWYISKHFTRSIHVQIASLFIEEINFTILVIICVL